MCVVLVFLRSYNVNTTYSVYTCTLYIHITLYLHIYIQDIFNTFIYEDLCMWVSVCAHIRAYKDPLSMHMGLDKKQGSHVVGQVELSPLSWEDWFPRRGRSGVSCRLNRAGFPQPSSISTSSADWTDQSNSKNGINGAAHWLSDAVKYVSHFVQFFYCWHLGSW